MRLLLGGMDAAARRLQQLHNVFGRPLMNLENQVLQIRSLSTSAGGKKLTIGDVSKLVLEPVHPELVPRQFLRGKPSQSVLQHLRWIMQKDSLGQDVFLIGPPGPLRRQIAMMYLELTKRELEYVSLSRDTTESDLKQRREIENGTASYIDQSAVRAALEGRILVLEGIEKAERNVLPVLNNLLENREMQLDDGRFQARDVNPTPFKELYEELVSLAPNVPAERISQMLSFATTLLQKETSPLGLPDFPLDNLPHVVKIMNSMPKCSDVELLHRIYPYTTMLGKDGKTAVEEAMDKFEISPQEETSLSLKEVSRQGLQATVSLNHKKESFNLQVLCGGLNVNAGELDQHFVKTIYHDTVLLQMMQSHLVKDFCIVGPRGCGKSVVVKQFADMLGYHIEPIMLYQDMTSRDLLQQRTTMPDGDTTWRYTPLVTAALEGSLAVLDGVHRVNAGSFSVLHRLVSERELQLLDGTRLIGQDKYDAMKKELNLSDTDLQQRKILPIHPSFRIVALSEPPVIGSSKQQWLSPEMLTMFLYHNMRPLSRLEEIDVISRLVPNLPDLNKLFDFVHRLRQSQDAPLQSLSSSLSTRQLLRIARRLATFPSEDLHSVIRKACLARFLPRMAQSALNQTLEESQITLKEESHHLDEYQHSITCEVKDGVVRIGQTSVPVYSPENQTKVPDILFYENPQHLTVMEDMLKDFSLGEHLLLVGNQGVGKNKIVDRFLQMLNRPREYVQLHRDTTVQTLTLQPTVKDGVIMYEDSPLVVAVKLGHVLVVDEADKAPTNVTCVLKTLVESGEMHLADGRRIVAANSKIPASPNVIVAHPDFRMVVLANRPGFPFLGNDFFGAMGDIFSCHAIDNPDMESEMAMLRQYGPDVSDTTLHRLVSAFADLREMADQGLISYPYSTREVVNMVRHLQRYPNEGLTTVVRNVFDFDSYNKELQETIVETMQKHGIPVGASQASVSLAKEIPMPKLERVGQWIVSSDGMRRKTGLMSLPVTTKNLSIKGPVSLYIQSTGLDRTQSRASVFSEQEAYSVLPLEENNVVCDIAVSRVNKRSPGQNKHDVIYVATCNPICLYTLTPTSHTANLIDMYDVFPSTMGGFKPEVKIQALASPLDDLVLMHESVTNVVIAVNVENGQLTRLMSDTLPEIPSRRRFSAVSTKVENPFRMCITEDVDPRGTILFYQQNGQHVEFLNVLEGLSHSVDLPFNIQTCHAVGEGRWLLSEAQSPRKYILSRTADDDLKLLPVDVGRGPGSKPVLLMGTEPLGKERLTDALGEGMSCPNRVAVLDGTYAAMLLGFPDLGETDVYAAVRDPFPEPEKYGINDSMFSLRTKQATQSTDRSLAYLPQSGQVVRALPGRHIPDEVKPPNMEKADLSGFLEVSDLANHKLRYIPVPGPRRISPYASWMLNRAECNLFLAPASDDGLVTVDAGGCVRQWETVPSSLAKSMKEWRDMLGYQDTRELQINEERESGRDHEDVDPKHGKEDPQNQPHVGGNTWAGGVGGSSTAGLGGFGGPYRLDAGHQVFQVPQWEKDAVPEHVKQAAREMGRKAYMQKLKEIEMSEYDGRLYEQYSASVRRQVQSLRVILDSLQNSRVDVRSVINPKSSFFVTLYNMTIDSLSAATVLFGE
ncbi:von Willebrand factor a domain-containing protein 8-like [Plakobranchus ocellatus]|uniref:von Willebrand factor A domain-containing protein 8 n=1 Tax=Plakobranchus ocellatus TaxID=259542 RepID=A0AAV4AJB3_9GAST|nr:von Willebrand factor a domain-containing protein 8-like [Plakobranchus ocellatus]